LASVSYSSPVQSGTVTSTVGPRSASIGASSYHYGTDFGVPTGTPVYSAADGTVSYVGNNAGGYGNYIVVDHADGTSTLYAHLSSTGDTYVGQTVGTDTPIGLSGATGDATGPHLHYEHYNTDDEELQSPFGDNQSLNDAAATKGSTVSKDDSSSSSGSSNGDTSNGQDNTTGKNGNQDGTSETDQKNKQIAQQTKPLEKKDHKDITGTPSNYKQTTTKSAVSVLPTHEPWAGHPISCKPPRQGTGSGGSGDDGSSGSSSGGGTGSSSGAGTGTGTGGGGGNTPPTPGSAGTGSPYNGSYADEISHVYDRLVNTYGFTPDAAQAATANIMGEGLLPGYNYAQMHNDVNGPSAGVAQWHDVGWNGGGRYSAYQQYMASHPGGAASLDNQIDYYVQDMKNNYPGVYNYLQNNSAEAGVQKLVYGFEKPADKAGATAARLKKLAKLRATLKKRIERGDPRNNDNKQDPKAANNQSGNGNGTSGNGSGNSAANGSGGSGGSGGNSSAGSSGSGTGGSGSDAVGTSTSPAAYTPPPPVGNGTVTASDGTTFTIPGISVGGK
jgi:hypothetical protein